MRRRNQPSDKLDAALDGRPVEVDEPTDLGFSED